MHRIDLSRLSLYAGLAVWTLSCHSAMTWASPPVVADRGIFEISIAGHDIGSERFQIIPAGERIVAKAEIELHAQKEGKDLVFRSFPDLVLDSHLQPLSYRWELKGSGTSRLEIDFTRVPSNARYHTAAGKEERREFLLPKDVVVLDDNVLSQYEILVQRYDKTSRGRQVFNAFIPQEGLPGKVLVVGTGVESVSVKGVSKSLRHLLLTTDLARIELWADPQGRLWRVSVPTLRFDAVRQK